MSKKHINMMNKIRLLSLVNIQIMLLTGIFTGLVNNHSQSLAQTINSSEQKLTNQMSGIRFKSRNPDNKRDGGGLEAPCIKEPVAVIPKTTFEYSLTTNPTIFVYVPESPNQGYIEFALMNEDTEEIVHETRFKPINDSGIISVTIPVLKNLQLNKPYRWYLSIVCEPYDPSNSVDAKGTIQFIEPSKELTNNLAHAQDRDRLLLYVNNGLWYDTLAEAARLRRLHPNDPQAIQDWESLLDSVGLKEFATKPLKEPIQIRAE